MTYNKFKSIVADLWSRNTAPVTSDEKNVKDALSSCDMSPYDSRTKIVSKAWAKFKEMFKQD